MKNNGVKANSVEECEAESQLIHIIEHCSADLDNSELGRLRRVGGRSEYPKVTFDLSFRSNGVQQTSNGILHQGSANHLSGGVFRVERTLSVCARFCNPLALAGAHLRTTWTLPVALGATAALLTSLLAALFEASIRVT